MVRKTSRILSYLSALLSALTLVRLRGRGMILWGVKMLAGAWTPFLAVAGGLGALIGLARRDRKAMWAGLFGAAVAVRHVVKVTAPGTDNSSFAQAFGSGWLSHIPPELRARMLPQRYTPLPPDPPEVGWRQDVVFGTHLETGDPLLCDIWQPPNGVPHTGLGVIYLHGSAWHYIDKDVGTQRFFRHLAGQGHVVMDAAYTLAPRAQLRAMVADVKRAIAWIKTHATEYGVNPERIVLVGGSAGGHLALLSAYTPNHPELQPADVDVDTSVRAVISYYGMPDLRASYDYFRDFPRMLPSEKTRLGRWCLDNIEAFFHRTRILPPYGQLIDTPDCLSSLMGGTPDEVPELYHLGSPINHVGPHCPPTLLLQGAHDSAGMIPDVRRLYRALRQAGVPSVYVEFPDTEHAFDLIFPKWAPVAQAATYDTERFLALMG
jgi:acetyl esterase/lipase